MSARGEAFNGIVGEKLEALIRSQGRSRRSVALAIGIDPVTLMNYVRGDRQIPIPVLVDACEHLGVTPYDFFIQCYFELGAPAGSQTQVSGTQSQSQSMWTDSNTFILRRLLTYDNTSILVLMHDNTVAIGGNHFAAQM